MFQKITQIFEKKSPKERFLLVIGMLFFLIYFLLGLTVIFWNNLPISMKPAYKMAFGILLIVYSFIRFVRYIKDNTN